MCLFWAFYMNRILQYVVFYYWSLWLNMMLPRTISVAVCVSTSFLFIALSQLSEPAIHGLLGLSEHFLCVGHLKELLWNWGEASMNTTQNEWDYSHLHLWQWHNCAEPKICLNRMAGPSCMLWPPAGTGLVWEGLVGAGTLRWGKGLIACVSGLGRAWVQFLIFRHLRKVCRGSPGSICSICQ